MPLIYQQPSVIGYERNDVDDGLRDAVAMLKLDIENVLVRLNNVEEFVILNKKQKVVLISFNSCLKLFCLNRQEKLDGLVQNYLEKHYFLS